MTAILGLATLAATACAPKAAETGTVAVQPVDPSFVHGTDGSDTDRLAATTVTDVQQYWSEQFPATFGTSWRPLDGGFFSVDTTTEGGAPPPCSRSAGSVEGNAYYCAAVDVIGWDRSALLPVLRERYGEASVVVVLAHELGHAVQQRSGTDIGSAQHLADPLRAETSADCYAGSFLRWVTDGGSDRLRITPQQLDGALRALIVFRDPLTAGSAGTDVHGTAFDRISAFQDGYQRGPRQCAETTGSTPPLPEAGTGPADGATTAYFADLVARHGGHWQPPRAAPATEECTGRPVAYCTRPPRIAVDQAALTALNHDIGDQAGPTLLASRHALAALDALGGPTTGRSAGERASCLTGAYTASLAGRGLSTGDLDEAVEVLLTDDTASRDAEGTSALSGFDRLASFRAGVHGGDAACGL